MPGFHQHIPDLCQFLSTWICISVFLFLETSAALPRIPFSLPKFHLMPFSFAFPPVLPATKEQKGIMELPFGLAGLHLSLQVIEFVPGVGKPGGFCLVFVTEVTNHSQGVAATQEPPKASSPGAGKFKVHPEQTFPEDS